MQDVLILETQVAGKGNPLTAQLRRLEGEIEAVSRHKNRMELQTR
jgi:hypothetical protein